MIRFDDILDQQHAIEWLSRAWREDRLPHGLIFAGPVGVGKATTARALATLFLCEKPKDDRPCGTCDSCRAMDANLHPDFHVVYRQLARLEKNVVAKELSVDVIRNFLIAPANLKASMNRGKVFVVEEADLMNPSAQNSMLKTLEEPAGRTLIALLTDQPHALLPTIRSRCQVLRFSTLDEKLVRDALVKRGIDKPAADDAARFAGGSLGLAQRWLEDGIIERAKHMVDQLDGIIAGRGAGDLQDHLKKSADAYAEAQLQRDPLSSKDQATREGIATCLRIASDHFRRRLPQLAEADEIEQTCSAIDAVAQSEQYLESNVNIPLVLQQFGSAMESAFAAAPVPGAGAR